MRFSKGILLSTFLSLSFACSGVYAEEAKGSIIELIKQKHDYHVPFSSMLKGELSIPTWISDLDANGGPASETTLDGNKYISGLMRCAADPEGDWLLLLMSTDKKKCWALEANVPPALRNQPHPEKMATLRYYGEPNQALKRYMVSLMGTATGGDGAGSAAPVEAPKPNPAPAPTRSANPAEAVSSTAVAPADTKPHDFSPQDDEKARKFRAELHAKKGKDAMNAQNYRQAEAEYREASKIETSNIQYLEGYALAASKANDLKSTIEAYGKLVKDDPSHHQEAHVLIAESLTKLGQYDEAVEEFKKAAPFAKDKAELWNKVAEIRIGQAKHQDAMEAYKNAIKADPSDGKAYRLLASIQWNAGSKSDALATYKNGSQSAPRDGDLLAAYAYALMSNQQWDEAAKAYKSASLIKGSTPELTQGYRSAMEHIAFEEEQAKRKAAKGKKK